MKVEITVVVCLYNAENYIIETIKSLERQTYKHFKLLIINDCSTDESLEKVNQYLPESSFDDYEIVDFKQNKGTAYIRDFALRRVDTPLMMFFDADDLAKPKLVEKLFNKLKENVNCITVSCYSSYIDSNSNKIAGGHYLGPVHEKEFFSKAEKGKFILMPCIALFKRVEALKAGGYIQTGFPENTKIRYQDLSEDLDLWSRMSDLYTKGKYMLAIPEVLFYYRKDTSSLSASKENLIAMQNKMRYVKYNLKRRRNNLENVTFINYINSINKKEKQKYYKKDMSAYYYRKAGFQFVNKAYLKFTVNIFKSIGYNPMYIIDKVKSNFLK